MVTAALGVVAGILMNADVIEMVMATTPTPVVVEPSCLSTAAPKSTKTCSAADSSEFDGDECCEDDQDEADSPLRCAFVQNRRPTEKSRASV